MELKMKMPDLSTTDSAIKVIRWLVTPGQPIKRGEALLEGPSGGIAQGKKRAMLVSWAVGVIPIVGVWTLHTYQARRLRG